MFTELKYIFDVDGTLTPSRQKVDPDFEQWLWDFMDHNDCYFATGSDYAKTLEQLDYPLCHAVKKSYNCCGNSVWSGGVEIEYNDWHLPSLCEEYLETQLTKSLFPIRAGGHIEHRTGSCNFSIVGRECNLQQREQYVQWDQQNREREYIAAEFNYLFSEQLDVTAQIGGETGLNIFKTGHDKSQIAKHFDKNTVFFGDKMQPGGNDYPLAQALQQKGAKTIEVDSWQDTWRYLKQYAEQYANQNSRMAGNVLGI